MSRTITTIRLENSADERRFSSPIARAFVRIRVSRGDTEANARKAYLDFLNRQQHPAGDRGQSATAC
jgi:hypothetical protein